ncbi:MAG: HAD family hydrolase [Myxococcaceae bacterium]|nr:HAD family hydrolase [Myxococcaceae bacterium]MCA3013011.1 HAD family hydrolase [Myxococcaceae bacterium]
MRFQAVIFDLDGTLADSLRDLGEAMNRALADAGRPTHPLEDYRRFVGEGVDVMVARAAAPESRPEVLRGIVDAYRQHYARIDHEHTRPYEGVPELLDALTARRVPMAVLSNKRDDFTRLLVRQRFGRWRFVEVRGEREGVPRKPDPTAALEVALALNVLPANICFVGDTAVDMTTATRAGMQRVGCLWGFRDRDELEGAGAQRVISRPLELLDG